MRCAFVALVLLARATLASYGGFMIGVYTNAKCRGDAQTVSGAFGTCITLAEYTGSNDDSSSNGYNNKQDSTNRKPERFSALAKDDDANADNADNEGNGDNDDGNAGGYADEDANGNGNGNGNGNVNTDTFSDSDSDSDSDSGSDSDSDSDSDSASSNALYYSALVSLKSDYTLSVHLFATSSYCGDDDTDGDDEGNNNNNEEDGDMNMDDENSNSGQYTTQHLVLAECNKCARTPSGYVKVHCGYHPMAHTGSSANEVRSEAPVRVGGLFLLGAAVVGGAMWYRRIVRRPRRSLWLGNQEHAPILDDV